MPTLAEVVSRFDDMPPRLIAFHLSELGIKGDKSNSVSCPIAVYVARELGASVVSVGGKEIHANNQAVPTPYTVLGFIDNFDEGKYPYLVRGV